MRPKIKSEQGAPAALARLERYELEAAQIFESARADLKSLQEKPIPKDEKKLEAHNALISDASRRALDAEERHQKAAKALLSFDKEIAPEKREGEKILVSEAREIYRQYELTQNLARELYITSIAQAAALCQSPKEFHTAHAANVRSSMEGAIQAAITEGVIPKWITL